MIYVTTDIHGCYDTFMKLLKKINFNQKDTMYILGDIIDRGPKSIEMIRFVMNNKNVKMIKGNHEEMMLKALLGDNKYDIQLWFSNGGEQTYDEFIKINKKEQNSILKYFDSLKNYYIVNDFVLVHSGIDSSRIDESKSDEENMKNQYESDLLWSRDSFYYNKTKLKDHIIIFGHTPTYFITQISPMYVWIDDKYQDKIGIDCGVVFSEGQLACLCLDDLTITYQK